MSQLLKTRFVSAFLLAAGMTSALVSCRPGAESSKSPIHINPNMDLQEKYKAQEESKFFEDGRTMRTPVAGTVAKVQLNDNTLAATNPRLDTHLYDGLVNGAPAKELPSLKTLGYEGDFKGLLEQGRKRYNIYCAPCHAESGDGQGIVGKRPGVMMPATNLTFSPKSAGEIYAYIKKGGPIMPSYELQIPVNHRWAIVSYVKVLQASSKIKAPVAAVTETAKTEVKEAAATATEAVKAEVKKLTKTELIAKGKLQAASCVGCHATTKAEEAFKTMAPSWVGNFGQERKVKVGEKVETITVDDTYLRESILKPAAKSALKDDGSPYPMAMMALPVEDVDAVIEYIKSLNK